MPPTSTAVAAHLEATVSESAEVVLAVALAYGPAIADEVLTVSLDGRPLTPEEVVVEGGGRLHVVQDVPPGVLTVDYSAVATQPAPAVPVTPADRVTYLRPSRYCPSDLLAVTAARLFGTLAGRELVDAVVAWVAAQTRYVPGVSGPTDGALDTLLAGQGVCRDFAHLVAALLRARGVPARVVSVYAPGLSPMDFHAVVEAALDGRWHLVDATGLAPRPAMVRIATGRDAADTAFLTVHSGTVDFGSVRVTCVALPDLPPDDRRLPVHL